MATNIILYSNHNECYQLSVFDGSHPRRCLEEVIWKDFIDAGLVRDEEVIAHREVLLSSTLVFVVVLVPWFKTLIILFLKFQALLTVCHVYLVNLTWSQVQGWTDDSRKSVMLSLPTVNYICSINTPGRVGV